MTPGSRIGGLAVALAVEWLKLRRAPVAWTAAAAIAVLVPLVSLGGYALVRAGGASPSVEKARAMAHGEGWDAVWSLGGQVVPIAVMLGAGIVGSWCVGREFTDGTVSALYAATVPPDRVVTAKLLLVVAWAAAVSTVAVAAVLLGGTAMGLPPRAGLPPAVRSVAVGVLVALSTLPTTWLASVRRGYLAGIGGTLGLVVLTQLTVAAGGGSWVPWAAPAFWAGAAGPAASAQVTALQLTLPAIVGMASAGAVIRWWRRAELGNAAG